MSIIFKALLYKFRQTMTEYWVIDGKQRQKFRTSDEAEAFAQFLRAIGHTEVKVRKKNPKK